MRHLIALAVLFVLPAAVRAQDQPKPVKVFILAGQPNMEGKAKLSLLDYQATLPANRELFRPYRKDEFWDKDAEAVFKKGWRENIDEWNKVGSDYPYHYLGSAKTMLAIGRALGEATLELRGER